MDVLTILLGIVFVVLVVIIIALLRNANTTKFTYGNSAYAPGNMQPHAQASFGNQPTPIFCTRCGKQDMSGRDFCGFCGNKLDRNGVPPYGPMGMNGNIKTPNAFMRLWKKSPVAVVLMFAAVGVLIGFIYEAFFSYDYEPGPSPLANYLSGSSSSTYNNYGSNDSSDDYYSSSNDYYSSYGSNSYSGYTYDVCSVCHGSKLCQVCHGRGGMSYATYGQGGSGWVDCTGCNGSRRCKYCD